MYVFPDSSGHFQLAKGSVFNGHVELAKTLVLSNTEASGYFQHSVTQNQTPRLCSGGL